MDLVTVLKLTTLVAIAGAGYRFIQADYGMYSRFSPAHRSGRALRLCAFHGVYLAAAAAPFLSPFIENDAIRVFFVLYFVLSGMALVAYRSISGCHIDKRIYFDEDVIELLWRERDMAGDAFRSYYRQIVPVLAAGALATAIFVWPPQAPYSSNWLTLPIIAGLTGIFLIALTRWSPPQPTISRIPIQLLIHILRKDMTPPKEPLHVTISPPRSPPINKVILVMDESVRGDYLSLANPSLDTTPYLAGLGDRLMDMGVAISSHNCSSYSRTIFRYGVRSDDLRYQLSGGLNFAGPNIWQYAHAAGFKTVYVDGFSTDSWWLHSGMTLREASFIDQHIPIPPAENCSRDVEVANRLIEALKDPAPALIYVDKYGLHSPYDDKYPVGEAHFPTEDLPRRAELIAHYKNGLRWSVDGFFRRIVPHIDLRTTAIFYTSDHGQSLMDKGYEGSHGSTGPNIAVGEAMVPFFAITESEPLRTELKEASRRCRNKLSHFELFPAILAAFGYDRAYIRPLYGEGPFGAPPAQRRFLTGFKRTATWVPVNEDEVAPGTAPQQNARPSPTPEDMEIIVINREQDKLRRERIAEIMQKQGIEFSLFPAVDAERGEHVPVSRHDPGQSRRSGGCVLAPCEIGCFASHYILWQRCAAGDRTYVVLEDDIDILPGFLQQLEMTKSLVQRGIVRLGFNPSGNRPLVPTTEKLNDQRVFLCPTGSTYGTFGYAIAPADAARLLAKADRWTEPVDHYLEATDKHGVANFSFDVPTLRHHDEAITPTTMTNRRLQRPFTPIELMQIALRRQWQKVRHT